MFKTISKFINSHAIGQLFNLGGKTAAWKKVRELKAGMKIAIAPLPNLSDFDDKVPADVIWDEIISVRKVDRERVWDIEVEGTHNFVAGHYVNTRTGKALTAEAEKLYLAWKQQKTTLADGSLTSSTVDTVAPELSSNTLSQKIGLVKMDSKSGPEGNRTPATRIDSSRAVPTAGPLPALSQILGEDVKEEDIVYGGIVAHNTSGILMRAGASSLQLSSSATSTTADIELAAADQMDLFASKFSLTTSSSSNGQIVLSSAGGITLDTSRGAGVLTITGSVNAAKLGEGTGTTLVADSNGNIIRNTSSLRYKHDVTDLDFDSSAIFNLDPKSFTWNSQGIRDFGLIAEEVAATLPQLALYDKEGRPEAVKYSQLSVLLLEETKKLKEAVELSEQQTADFKRSLLAGQGDSSSGEWETALAEIDSKIFGAQAAFDAQQTMIESLQTQIDDLKRSGESSANDDIESLKNRVSLLEESFTLETSTGSNAALVGDLTLDSSSDYNSYNLYNNYKFYSETEGFAQILAPTTIGGSLTVGTLYFDDLDSSINSLGDTLRIQPTALADIEFLGGKIIMDKKGNLTVFGEIAAEKVAAGQYTVLGAGKTIGSGKILAGETSLIIENGKVNENSKIFTQLTATAALSGNPTGLVVTKLPGQGFEVNIAESFEDDITFDYWIIQEE